MTDQKDDATHSDSSDDANKENPVLVQKSQAFNLDDKNTIIIGSIVLALVLVVLGRIFNPVGMMVPAAIMLFGIYKQTDLTKANKQIAISIIGGIVVLSLLFQNSEPFPVAGISSGRVCHEGFEVFPGGSVTTTCENGYECTVYRVNGDRQPKKCVAL